MAESGEDDVNTLCLDFTTTREVKGEKQMSELVMDGAKTLKLRIEIVLNISKPVSNTI